MKIFYQHPYRDVVIGGGKIRNLHWWNRWYWKRRAIQYPLPKWDGVERYIVPRIFPDA